MSPEVKLAILKVKTQITTCLLLICCFFAISAYSYTIGAYFLSSLTAAGVFMAFGYLLAILMMTRSLVKMYEINKAVMKA